RLAPGEEALVRTIYAGQGLPGDRESLFWINIQEIPPRSEAANALQVAIRTRIQLLYRPPGLQTTLDEAARALQWRIDGQPRQPVACHLRAHPGPARRRHRPGHRCRHDRARPDAVRAAPAAEPRLARHTALRLHQRLRRRFRRCRCALAALTTRTPLTMPILLCRIRAAARRGLVVPRLAPLAAVVCALGAGQPAAAQEEFNLDFLRGDARQADVSALTSPGGILPGTYPFTVYLNGTETAREDIVFVKPAAARVQPCLNRTQLAN